MRASVQTKLFAAFGLVVALMVALGVFAVTRLSANNFHLHKLGSVVVPSTRSVGDINALMNKYRKDQLHYVVAEPRDRPLSAPGSIQGDLNDDLSGMSALLDHYAASGLIEDPIDGGLLNKFKTDFHRYVALTASFEPLANQGFRQPAANVIGNGPGDHQWDILKDDIGSWNNHKIQRASAVAAASHDSYETGVRLILILLGVALVLAIVVAVVIARKTTRAVRSIGTAARAIAQGDIDQHVDVRGRDELAQMAADFDTMIAYLDDTVAVANAVAAGDLEVEVQPRSERDALGNALAAMTASLRKVHGENQRLLAQSRHEANTDALTGLGNRRALMSDLEQELENLGNGRELMLALFDLDGFKEYNDTFGHPTGDALLARIGDRIRRMLDGDGKPYRMGGDEFCILVPCDSVSGPAVASRAAKALSESGEAFSIGCSYGMAHLPQEATSPSDALRLADDRMYEDKTARVSDSRQSTDVLLNVLGERNPGMIDHLGKVGRLAVITARQLGLSDADVKRVRIAAELHAVGKVAIPDTILNKPGPLDEEEWEFIRRHTEIGERIINAAPSLAPAAKLVRFSHERHAGRGYPDHLRGDEIPLGARIIAVCDAFDAMTSERAYSEAISVEDALVELRRCSGSQFHPGVVEAFCSLIEKSGLHAVEAA